MNFRLAYILLRYKYGVVPMLLLDVKYIRLDKVCRNLFKSIHIGNKLYIPDGTEGPANPDVSHKWNLYNTSCPRKNLYPDSLNFDFYIVW